MNIFVPSQWAHRLNPMQKNLSTTTFFVCLPFFLLAIMVTFLVRDNAFFWDTIQLASKQAHFFYETDFQSIILPQGMDSGHPPAFGMYLAACWKLFGKSLPVSHFAMLPFLLGNIFLIFKIGQHFVDEKHAFWLLLLLFADPTMASQSLLISPDIALIFFFLLGFWSLLKDRKTLLIFAVAGLGLVSLRGMMVGVVLYLFSWTLPPMTLVSGQKSRTRYYKFFQAGLQKILPFLPGGFIAFLFLLYHFQQTGWLGYHDNSPWSPRFENVDFQGAIKNVGILIWQLLDFGRVFIWLVIGIYFWRFSKKKLPTDARLRRLLWLLALSFLVLCPTLLIHKAILAHRYLLPIFLVVNFLCFFVVFKKISSSKMRRILFGIAFFGLLSGNFWIYPKEVAQGWDSTLAHLPYYQLREKMIRFIAVKRIPYGQIGTVFPNIGPFEKFDLNGVEEGFVSKDFEANRYLFYATIMNDFSDAELEELESNWKVVKKVENGRICVILFKNPRFD